MIKPNLLIAGFQKCGSSTLFSMLSEHPDINGSYPKETYILSDKSYEHYNYEKSIDNPDLTWGDFFKDGDVKYLLEGSVSNFYQRNALSYVKNNPKVKVIFIVRDPIDRFISTYNYFGSTGVFIDPNITLSEFFYLVNEGDFFKKEALNFALEHGRYHEFINVWENCLGKDSIYILGLNELLNETDHVMSSIYSFLSLPNHRADLKNENKTRPMKFKTLNRYLVSFFGGLGLGNSLLAKKYYEWNRTMPSHKLPEDIRLKLKDYYKEEYVRYGAKF